MTTKTRDGLTNLFLFVRTEANLPLVLRLMQALRTHGFAPASLKVRREACDEKILTTEIGLGAYASEALTSVEDMLYPVLTGFEAQPGVLLAQIKRC